MKKNTPYPILLLICLFIAGCYTQFGHRISMDSSVSPTPHDSTDHASFKDNDTVRVNDKEYCFWEQDFWGEWHLRCYDSNYPIHWFYYRHHPWWLTPGLMSNLDCHCPYHSFYHPSCQYCFYACQLATIKIKKDTLIINQNNIQRPKQNRPGMRQQPGMVNQPSSIPTPPIPSSEDVGNLSPYNDSSNTDISIPADSIKTGENPWKQKRRSIRN